MYLNYKASYNTAKKENLKFESYYNQEIEGAELATIINRAINENNINEIEKNKKGKFIDNDKNSINIFIGKNQTKYKVVQYYNKIKFKCTDIKYHKTTNKVKYMLFEQITQ